MIFIKEMSLRTITPIATARLRLRVLESADAAAFRTMTDDPAITDKVHFLSRPFTISDAERLIVADGDGRDVFWGVWAMSSDPMIGTVGTHLRGLDEIEIGYWFADSVHGHGLATEAVGAIIHTLGTALPRRAVYAECKPENTPSWRLLELLGFRCIGQDGLRPGRKRLSWDPVLRDREEC